MGEPEESLAAELGVTGSTAWGRLYEDVSAGVTATVEHPDGRTETLPIFAVRGLATHPDAAVREAAFRAELAAWQARATPIAAALNAIKGETLALGRPTRLGRPLAFRLEASAVEREAFDAMQAAVDASLPDFRRYLAAKARLLGKPACAFWDLFAPVGDAPTLAWPDATAAVDRAFAGYGDDLAGLAREALDQRWVDAGPRAGKVGGGVLHARRRRRQPHPHELRRSHRLGAHTGPRAGPRLPQPGAARPDAAAAVDPDGAGRDGQHLLRDDPDRPGARDRRGRRPAGAARGRPAGQLPGGGRHPQPVPVRVGRVRAAPHVDPAGPRAVRADARRAGRGLRRRPRPAELHPLMWAAKPHYYGSTFYNWPYTFGLLFGLGLYARWRDDPDGFRSAYHDMLSSTGLETASQLAGRFGIDVADQAFWTTSLDVVRRRIDDFCAEAPEPGPGT